MKTEISLPDTVFKEADRFAKKKNKSRSQLYAEAIEEYLYRHNEDEITKAMNHVIEKIGYKEDKIYNNVSRMLFLKETW
jgi:metal-responsive CopG/Arc/MetJ family transcriptional regulator